MTKPRLRSLGIALGQFPTGQHNAITDVAGVRVGHHTLICDEPRVARTGVTVIIPGDEPAWKTNLFAGCHSFNGNGEMTGIAWVEESGLLSSSIAITNTHQVGTARDALVADAVANGCAGGWLLPVAAETYDGFLNDIDAFHLKQEHVFAAIASASGGAVAEGSVGGGTGMLCHQFKGGIGTASRVAPTPSGQFTVGVLAQANYGLRQHLRVDGVPVGKHIGLDRVPAPKLPDVPLAGSIIVVVATDAPLIPTQCKRLAQRVTVGLGRVGGMGHNGSGDLFLAFSTANRIPAEGKKRLNLDMLPHPHLNRLFEAVVEATEEAILNALVAAETMTGFNGVTAYALPHDELVRVMEMYRVKS